MHKKKWVYILNVIIILLITSLTIYKLLKEDPKAKLEALTNLSIYGIIIILSIYIINALIEGFISKLVINGGKTKITFLEAIEAYCVGALFSNITPMKIGNMPSIVYAHSKSGIKVNESIAYYIQENLIYLFNMAIICIMCLITCYSLDLSIVIGNTSIKLALVALTGLFYNFLLVAVSLLIAYNSFLQNLFLRVSGWLLFKFKRINNREDYYNQEQEKLILYRQAYNNFFKNLKLSIITLFLFLIKTFIWGSVPYVIYILISHNSFNIEQFFYSFILSQLLYYVASIVPIPGASGAIELSFIAVYSNIISESYLVSVVLLWRVITYFIPIIVGFISFILVINKKKKPSLDNLIN